MAEHDVEARAMRRLGTVLRGKYRLDSVLGVGGMSVVYAATHRNQKRFAVKVLHAELSIDPNLRGRFQREGYLANTVNHPGAIAVLDDDTAEDGSAFLVMELLEGLLVEEALRRDGRLGLPIVAAIVDQLLSVLEAAHAKGIVHRDVKPGNLFMTRDGTVKVLDFGIAHVRALTGFGPLSTAGTVLGTPAFMAPEQAAGQSRLINPRTDVWAVGASMFTLLSGASVHSGETVQEVVVRAATRPPRSLACVAPELDARIAAVVNRALAFERAERWPDASAMREGLRQAYPPIAAEGAGRAELAGRVAAWDANEPTAMVDDGPPGQARDDSPGPNRTAPMHHHPARTSPPVAHSIPAARPRANAASAVPSRLPRARRLRHGEMALGALGAVAVVTALIVSARHASTPSAPRAPASEAAGAVAASPLPPPAPLVSLPGAHSPAPTQAEPMSGDPGSGRREPSSAAASATRDELASPSATSKMAQGTAAGAKPSVDAGTPRQWARDSTRDWDRP